MTKAEILKAIEETRARSVWQNAVKWYAEWLVDENVEDFSKPITEKAWSGCAYCYNHQICETLATPSEQRRTKNGALRPNSREEWLDVQARALAQAAMLILGIVNSNK